MTGALAIAAGFALLAAPGIVLRASPLNPRETARLAASTLAAGSVLIVGGLVLLALPAIVGAAHLGDLAEICARVLTPLTPRRDLVGLISAALAVILIVRAANAAWRAHRGAQRARAEPWLGHHEDRDDFELVILPTDDVLAFSVPGRKPQVLISRGLVAELEPRQVDAVIRHEAAHHDARHSRYSALAISVEAAFRPLRGVARSAEVLRAALESWADDAATSDSSATRASLRSALVFVAGRLTVDSRRASGLARRTRRLDERAVRIATGGGLLHHSPLVLLTSSMVVVALGWASGVHHLAAAAGYCFD